MDLRSISVGLILSLLLNQCLSFYQSEEVTIVPRAQEKTYSKIKNKSDFGIFIDVARGLGRAVKQVRSLFFNFLTQVREPMNEVEESIREIKDNKYKRKRPSTSEAKRNTSVSVIVKRKSALTTDGEFSKVELVRDLVSVFREVSGTFVEFFRTIASPVRDLKRGIAKLDYTDNYSEEEEEEEDSQLSDEYEPKKFRRLKKKSPSFKKRTTVRTIVLKRIVRVRGNGTKIVKKRIVRKKRRRISRRKKKTKSEQTRAMEELLTHI